MEVWKDIKGYEGLYQVSNMGRFKNVKRNAINSTKSLSCGYPKVTLHKNGKREYTKVHRLVAEAFIPNKYNKSTVNHINGIKTDNRVSNLEWMTHVENLQHYWKHKGKAKTVLSEQDVRDIRHLKKIGNKNKNIAKLFNVTSHYISRIVTNEIRNNVCEGV